jgi:large subunit ribosomal protein L23
MKDIGRILLNPVLSEKASNMKPLKKYVFRIGVDYNKIEVKKAIEDLYSVKVEKVNIVNMAPKYKRVRLQYGFTRAWKKAIVTLKEGEIDLYKA